MDTLFVKNRNCKFPKEATEIERMMKNFPNGGVRLKMRKQYPHPHTLSNLKRLARMPIGMK